MKRIVFLTAWLMCGLLVRTNLMAQWKYEEYTNALDGSKGPLTAPNNIVRTQDPLLAQPNSKPAVTAVNEIDNIVSVALNEAVQFGNTLLPDDFSITVNANITVQTVDGNSTTTNRDFIISYSKSLPYKRSDIFYFTGGVDVSVEIVTITPNNISSTLANSLILVNNDMRIDRSYTTDCADCGVGAFNNYTTTISGDRDELPVSWPANKWAKAYDLEWTYVSDEAYNDNRYGTTPADFARNVFRNNSTRVTVTDLSYNIPLLFNDNGHVVFRYRAVQQLAGGERITSKWSPEYDVTNGLGNATFVGHQGNLNWQASTDFAEEGKLKSMVQYFDGTLRGRQTVTKDNVTKNTVVAESLYDHQGRPAITVLPAPTLSSIIKFTPLNTSELNNPGSEYKKDLYDGLATSSDYCNGAAPGMGTDTGASRYYSPLNPLIQQGGIHRYIPDAETFPFSETKYTQDNTGRIAAKGGVGAAYRLGVHDTKYFYAAASQTDLDALFGTDAGDASHYQKNMVRDANGQYTVNYVDMKGQTVAAAMAGSASSSLQQLYTLNNITQTESLLAPANNIVKGNSIVFTRSIVVPEQASCQFTYTLNPQTLKLANWAGQDVCYDCLYDLTITIADECNNQHMPGGVPYVYRKSNFSLNSINSNCSDPSRGLSESFNVTLPEGSYTITKVLSISQSGKQYYRDNIYMPNNSKTTFDEIYNQQYQLVQQQLGDCNTNGDITPNDNDDINDIADRMYAQMTGDGVYAAQFSGLYNFYNLIFNGNAGMVRTYLLRQHPEYQVYYNYTQLVQSNKWDDAMNKVNTYAQAVQGGYLNPLQQTTAPASAFPGTNPDPFFQMSSTYKNQMTIQMTQAMITRLILNFIPVEWANMWSLSNMLVKCNALPGGGMDPACIATYRDPNNVFNPSLLCDPELDAAWNKFKALYLAKKKLLTDDFMFAQGYPVVNDDNRIFVDPRQSINQQVLGINPNERDPAVLQQQAQAALSASIDQNCRNYAAYWWSKLNESSCLLLKDRDSAAIVDQLIAVCKEGGDETHPFGASTVKPGSTSPYKSFNDVIIDYIRKTSGTNQDITLCNGTLLDAPGPYARPFVAINKPVLDKPSDCECNNIQGLYQVYQTSYASKYSTMSAFMAAVYHTTITDGALDTLRRMCNDEFHCVSLTGDNSLSADLILPMPTSGDYKATHSITMDNGFETTGDFTAEITIARTAGQPVVALLPVLQCGNVESVCVDCGKVNSAYVAFTQAYPSVTPTKDDDAASKNTFFAGYLNDQTGLNKTATEYLNFIDQCNSTPGSYAGSLDVGTTCTADNITVASTGVPKPSNISCDDLVNTYKNFIAEFPDHVHGATVHMYVDDGTIWSLNNSNEPNYNTPSFTVLAANLKPGPNVPGFMQSFQDTVPMRAKTMTALASLPPTGHWTDVTMDGQHLFEWYMSEHFNLTGYTYLNFADWLVNGCGYTLNQLPWDNAVAVKADALLSIWNQFAGRYPASQTNISETVNVPVVKGITSNSLATSDIYDGEYVNAMTWTQGSWFTTREANTYNLSVLPKNASIQSASLSLYAFAPSYRYAPHFRYADQFPYMELHPAWGIFVPGKTVFNVPPDNYPGSPVIGLPYLSSGQVSGGSNDFWSNQDYVNQNISSLVSSMYNNMQSTGVNYPVQYRLNDEGQVYKAFYFGGTTCSNAGKRPVLNVSYSASRCDVFTSFVNNALGTYLNLTDVKALFAAKGMTINNECNAFTGSASCGSIVKVYKSDLLLCGYDTAATFIPLPEDVLPNACKDGPGMAYAAAQEIYNFRRDSLLGNFDDVYTQKCLSAADIEGLSMQVTTQIGEYQYTLHYYDQAGNLIKTVPPAGVVVNRDPVWLQQVKDKRAAGQTLTPLHTKYTLYRYNSINQVISQYNPDGGQTNMWYDRLGRLTVSRNAEQNKTNLYTYTLYDELGRIKEVGQKQQPNGMNDATARKEDRLNDWVNLSNTTYPHTQVTRTVYDLPASINQVYTSFSQKDYTLHNRISYTQFFDQLQFDNENKPIYLNHTEATYYDYDIHGNVSTLLHDYAGGPMASNGYNRFKMVAYDYDLISGKVTQVSYQPGKQDELYHRYVYDAENRVTDVYTTHRRAFVGDRNVEEHDAGYSFYRHGPMARIELGSNKVQGLDYAYTLQGWLKGVNSTALNPTFDMGEDGINTSSLVARDAIGFSLNYYMGDYKTIDATRLPFAVASLPGNKSLYNGNISNMHVGIKGMETMLYNYGYDQLHRLVNMNAFNNFDNNSNQWSSITAAGKYSESITYDPNGNIQTYNRDGDKAGAEAMDRLQYTYIAGTNKLDHVTDDVTDDARYATDIDGQAAGNYDYDAIGNLTQDLKENISRIEWTVYGKIKRIEKNSGVNIDYTYDAAGNRISKTLSGTGVTGGPITTWYAKDAQGNTLSTYTIKAGAITADEQYVYGDKRLGVKNRNLLLNNSLSIASRTVPGIGIVYDDEMMRGKTQYELSNHLGNVLATISDKKVPHINGTTVDYYEPEIISAQDYYPFGMLQPGRSPNAGKYRYGFNGKENDNDVKGEGNQQDYGMRIYDPRVGRFLSVDPLTKDYPELTPYQFASNSPIQAIDLDGLEAFVATEKMGTGHAFLVVKTADELIVYTYGRYGDVDWNQTSGEGILIRQTGKDAINYINTELTKMDAKFFKVGDVSAANIKDLIDGVYNGGKASKDKDAEGKVIDQYSLFSSNCSTHSCDWLIGAGTEIFNESTLGIEYQEDFVIPSSLENYLTGEVKEGKKPLTNANEEMKQIVIDEVAKQKLQGAGMTAEASGSSGRSSGGSTNSSSAGSSSGRNTSSGSSAGSALGSSSSGPVGSSSGAAAGSSSGNGHSSSGSSFKKSS